MKSFKERIYDATLKAQEALPEKLRVFHKRTGGDATDFLFQEVAKAHGLLLVLTEDLELLEKKVARNARA